MATNVSDPIALVQAQLDVEFGGIVPEAVLRQQAEESLARFDGARITAFVPLLAAKDARSRLRRGTARTDR